MRKVSVYFILAITLLLAGCGANTNLPVAGKTSGHGSTNSADSKTLIIEAAKPENDAVSAECCFNYAKISLPLPNGWEYKIIEPDAENDFGISFWPAAEPKLTVTLLCHPKGFGICGTGVTFEEVSFSTGLTATKCTEGSDTDFWFLLIFKNLPGAYTAECNFSGNMWANYGKTLMALLGSAELGADVLPEEEAISIAEKECTINYDSKYCEFDVISGKWTICFYKSNNAGGDQTVIVSPHGEIKNISYGE